MLTSCLEGQVRVYLDFLGCRLNEAELSSWRRQLTAQGHQLTDQANDAHVIALNTCAVTSEAARKSRKQLRLLHKQNPKALMVATGCYATLSAESVQNMLGVDLVVPNSEKDILPLKLEALTQDKSMPELATEPAAQPIQANSRTRAFVKIQDGCRNKCTFCIVTVARGEEKSRMIHDIVDEINHLCALGYQEAVLTGVHIGGYGGDINTNLRSLIEAILTHTDIPRLRVGSLEPWDIPDGFFELFQNPRLCPHLHLPLQSGSDTVLKRMIRRCRIQSFAQLLSDARSAHPDMNVTTDLIVGFPGETETEFQETLETLERFRFGDMHLFRYSARAGTAASRLPNPVPPETIKKRHQLVQQRYLKHRSEYWSSMVNQVHPVLWERDVSVLDTGELQWSGYTHNYVRVSCKTSKEQRLFNECTQTKITGHNDRGLLGVSQPE